MSQRAKVGFRESYAGSQGSCRGLPPTSAPPLLGHLEYVAQPLTHYHLPTLSLCANKQRVALLQGFLTITCWKTCHDKHARQWCDHDVSGTSQCGGSTTCSACICGCPSPRLGIFVCSEMGIHTRASCRQWEVMEGQWLNRLEQSQAGW